MVRFVQSQLPLLRLVLAQVVVSCVGDLALALQHELVLLDELNPYTEADGESLAAAQVLLYACLLLRGASCVVCVC